jgi:hypothetical protein
VDDTNKAYDPIQLTHEVFRLLQDKGIPVERIGALDAAIEGSSQILRYLGMNPVVPSDLAEYRRLDLNGQLAYNRRIHGD